MPVFKCFFLLPSLLHIISYIIIISAKSTESVSTVQLCNITRQAAYILRPISKNITVDCIALSKTHTNATWYKGLWNSDKLKPVPNLHNGSGLLVFSSVKISDVGFYSCLQTNGLNCSIYLDILYTKPVVINPKETPPSLAMIGQVAKWSIDISAYPVPNLVNDSSGFPEGVNYWNINTTITEIDQSFYYRISVSVDVQSKEAYGNYCITIRNKRGKLKVCHFLIEGVPTTVDDTTLTTKINFTTQSNYTTTIGHPASFYRSNRLLALASGLFALLLLFTTVIYFRCLYNKVTRQRRATSRNSNLTNSSSNYDRIDWNLTHYQVLDIRTRSKRSFYDELNRRPISSVHSFRTSASSGNTFVSPYEIQRIRLNSTFSLNIPRRDSLGHHKSPSFSA